MFYNAVFVYVYLYGLWPEIKSYIILYYTQAYTTAVLVPTLVLHLNILIISITTNKEHNKRQLA